MHALSNKATEGSREKEWEWTGREGKREAAVNRSLLVSARWLTVSSNLLTASVVMQHGYQYQYPMMHGYGMGDHYGRPLTPRRYCIVSSHSVLPVLPLLVPIESKSPPLSLLILTGGDAFRNRRVVMQRATNTQPQFSDDSGNLFFQQRSYRSTSPGWVKRRPDGGREMLSPLAYPENSNVRRQ